MISIDAISKAPRQPQYVTKLSPLARSLGFTHAYNWGEGKVLARNIATGRVDLSLYLDRACSITPAYGELAVKTDTASGGISIAGNPFSTADNNGIYTVIWAESGVQSSAQNIISTTTNDTGTAIQYNGGTSFRLRHNLTSDITIVGARNNAGNINFGGITAFGSAIYSVAFNDIVRSNNVSATTGHSNSQDLLIESSTSMRLHGFFLSPKSVQTRLLGELTKNPWLLLARPSRRVFSASSTAYNLALADILHNNSNESLVLSSDHLLALDDILHNHTADSLTISSEILVQISDIAHAFISDNIVLTSDTSLAVNDNTHSLISDNIILSALTGISLIVADNVHSISSDNVILSSSELLAVSDIIHSFLSDIIILDAPAGACPSVSQIADEIMLRINAKNFLTVPKFLGLK